MSYTITVLYLDDADNLQKHEICGAADAYLTYDDLLAEPIKVRGIIKHGLVLNRQTEDRTVARSGSYIPAHRIVRILWEDDYKE